MPRPCSRSTQRSTLGDMEVSATGQRTELLSAAALVFVAFLFGTSFVIVKGALDDVDPVPFLALRGLFAALALAPFTIGRASKPGEVHAATMTGLMYLAGMLSQTIGLQYTTAATSAFLTYLLIVIVPFVSFAIGKARPTRITVVAIGVALVGLALLTGAGDGFGRGAVLTLIGAVAFAIHLVQMGEYSPRYDIFRFNAIQMTAVAVPCLLLVPFTGGLPSTGESYAVAAYAGIVVSALALIPWTWAQRHIPPTPRVPHPAHGAGLCGGRCVLRGRRAIHDRRGHRRGPDPARGRPGRARTCLDRAVRARFGATSGRTNARGLTTMADPKQAEGTVRAVGPPRAPGRVRRRGVGAAGRQLQVDRDEAVRGARRLGRHRARARREDAPRHPLLQARLARRAVAQAAARAAGDEPRPAHRAGQRRARGASSTR